MSVLEFSKTYKPFKYPWAVEASLEHDKIHWLETEVDLSPDVADFKNNLSPEELNLVTQILKLFTQSDTQVAHMYTHNLIPVFKNNEIQMMLISFASREIIHQRGYALLLETLNFPDSEFEAFLDYKAMADKIEFMNERSGDSHTERAISLARNIFSEGVSLFGSFVMLMNFQRYGKMRGMCEITRWSCLDEEKHVEGLTQLFRTYLEEHPKIVVDNFKKTIYDMARRINDMEEKFIDLAYEMGDVRGLAKEEVKQYIKYLIDRRLISMGLKGNFKVKDNPIPWFDEIMTSATHENFFEARVTEYTKGGMSGTWEEAWRV
jgi:ribonucleotide reductase beta subunit family protein with ferritin-like domain